MASVYTDVVIKNTIWNYYALLQQVVLTTEKAP